MSLIFVPGRRISTSAKPDFLVQAAGGFGIDFLAWPSQDYRPGGEIPDLTGRWRVGPNLNGGQWADPEGRAWRTAGSEGELQTDCTVLGNVPFSFITLVKFIDFAANSFQSGDYGSAATIYSQRYPDAIVSPTLLVSAAGPSGSGTRGLWFGTDSAGTAVGVKGGTTIYTGRYYFIVATYDPAGGQPGGYHVYLDGKLDDATTSNIGSPQAFTATPGRFGFIGRSPVWGDPNATMQYLYFARSNRALSAREVAHLNDNRFALVRPTLRDQFASAASAILRRALYLA